MVSALYSKMVIGTTFGTFLSPCRTCFFSCFMALSTVPTISHWFSSHFGFVCFQLLFRNRGDIFLIYHLNSLICLFTCTANVNTLTQIQAFLLQQLFPGPCVANSNDNSVTQKTFLKITIITCGYECFQC